MSKLIAFNKSSSALCGPVGVALDSPIIIVALEVSTTLIGVAGVTVLVLELFNISNTCLVNTKPQEETKSEKTATPVTTPINIIDTSKATIIIGESDTTPTGPQSAEEDLLKAMSLLNTYNKEAPDGTLGKEEIKPKTDIEEQTGRNADNNIVVDNPEALKKWNELSNDTRELLSLMNINETDWNNMLPKQRESELNCLS